MAQTGGRYKAEERRLCEAVAILMISRRRKAMYGGLFRKLNKCPYPASSKLGSSTMAGRSLANRYVDKLHLPGGGVSLGGK
jgi:hypothetical protein